MDNVTKLNFKFRPELFQMLYLTLFYNNSQRVPMFVQLKGIETMHTGPDEVIIVQKLFLLQN